MPGRNEENHEKLRTSGVPVEIGTKHLSNFFKALLTNQPIRSHPVNLTESPLVEVIYRNGSLNCAVSYTIEKSRC